MSSESKVLVLFLFLWQTLYKVSDHGMLILLKFLRLFITMIGKMAKVESVFKIAQTLPQTLYMAKSYIGLGRDEFEKFVACPKCCAFLKSASPGGKETSLEIQWVMYLKAEFGKNSWILMEILTSQKQET